MRRIINSTYISLDGVIENPQDWPYEEVDGDTGQAVQAELLDACDAMLMGRHTYDGFAPVWQARAGDPFSDKVNAMAKYVVSSTLRDPEWTNTTVIDGDVAGEVRRLKERPGKDIVQYGFGDVSYTLLDHGLLDEIRFWFHPLLVRSGSPRDMLFREGPLTRLTLVDTQVLKSGNVILSYRPR